VNPRRAREAQGADGGDRGAPVAFAAHGPRVLQLLEGQSRARLGHATAAVRAAERRGRAPRARRDCRRCSCRTSSCASATQVVAGERRGPATFDEAIALAERSTGAASCSSASSSASGRPRRGEHEPGRRAPRRAACGYRRTQVVCCAPAGPRCAAAAFALARGIETDYVPIADRAHGLAAPDDAGRLPFRLRIHAARRFELVRDGVPMRFSGKRSRGRWICSRSSSPTGGSASTARVVMAALWPDADGASAKASFDAALVGCASCWTSTAPCNSRAASSRSAPTGVDRRACAGSHARVRATRGRRRARTRRRLPAPRGRCSQRNRAAAGTEDEAAREAARRLSFRACLRVVIALGGALEAVRDWPRRSTSTAAGSRPTTSPTASTGGWIALASPRRRPGEH